MHSNQRGDTVIRFSILVMYMKENKNLMYRMHKIHRMHWKNKTSAYRYINSN